MSEPALIDLFAEDRGHEAFLLPLLSRLARESGKTISVRVRSARGGHGRAISELTTYQRGFDKGIGGQLPDLLVVAIDGNCEAFAAAQRAVQDALREPFAGRAIKATPDPHIERWFLADLEAFHTVVGVTPSVKTDKCERDYYKGVLAESVVQAGHPLMLGGIEFAPEIVEALDYYRAGKADTSFKHFLEEIRARIQSL
jgi:hypothetical protein